MIGDIYNSLYGHADVRNSVTYVQEVTKKHNIDTHSALLRWTVYHSILDAKYGDGVIFAVSKMEQLEKSLDAISAGPLTEDLADAINAVYATVKGNGPAYHM